MKKKSKGKGGSRAMAYTLLSVFFACVLILIALSKNGTRKLIDLSLDELDEELRLAIEEQDFMYAATVRDIIKYKKKHSANVC